jgi:hypothetical protein
MIENVLHHIGGIGHYGVLSICLFFGCFVGVLIWALCLKKPYLNSMRRLPLEDDDAADASARLCSNPETRHE